MPSSKELRDIAKDLKIRGYSKMNKSALTEAIEEVARSTKDSKPLIEDSPSPPPVPSKKVARQSKSPWVEFCKEYAKLNGCSYKEAMSQKEKYSAWKESRATTKPAASLDVEESQESEETSDE